MYSFRKSKKGFTLIELMVVVAIIAVLSLLGLRVYTGQATKAKNSSVQANIHSLATELGVQILDQASTTYDFATAQAAATKAQIVNPFTPAEKGSAMLVDSVAATGTGNTVGRIYCSEVDAAGDPASGTGVAYRLEGIKNTGEILITTDVNFQ